MSTPLAAMFSGLRLVQTTITLRLLESVRSYHRPDPLGDGRYICVHCQVEPPCKEWMRVSEMMAAKRSRM